MKSVKNKVIPTHLYCDKGFTLAEVLIALVVIGVIAAITMTTVMPNIQERVNSQRQANIVYKVTQATNLMKSNGAMVEGFASTDAFVDELQKYLKIMKRCDSEHIADCWPTKKVIDSEGNEYDVSKAINRGRLGFMDKYQSNKNVGIVLNDGASIIMTYNPASGGIGIGDKITSKNIPLPVGGKYEEFIEYTTNTTGGLAFVMDVNGGKGPNKESVITEEKTKYYDIRNLNGAHFAEGFVFQLITSQTAYNCSEDSANKFCSQKTVPGGQMTNTITADRWAGAMNDCDSLGGYVPKANQLIDICNDPEERAKYGLTNFRGELWTSELCRGYWCSNGAQQVNFSDCKERGPRGRTEPQLQALCIAN